MNDDLIQLASAYLDGDVTADERARVDADAVALAEVERLRAVRALLGDVEPASISVREAQLATALGIWERLPEAERTGARRDQTPAGIDAAAVAGAASVTAPTRLNSRRRTTSPRWLAGAAAALVLVLAGGLALQLDTSENDDAAESAGTVADEAIEPRAADDDLSAAELAPAGDAAPEVGSNEVDTAVADPAPPAEDGGLVQLLTLTDLADFAGAAVGAPQAPDLPAATSAVDPDEDAAAEAFVDDGQLPRCLGVDLVVGPAVYGDVPVVVGIDEGRNLAIAYEPASCAEVARVRLP